jgi:hypothetical protein
MLPRRLLPWLFALTLLFGQAAAFAHALGHLSTDDGLTSDPACEVCLGQAQLGGGVAPTIHTPPATALASAAPPTRLVPVASAAPTHAHARAPPASI